MAVTLPSFKPEGRETYPKQKEYDTNYPSNSTSPLRVTQKPRSFEREPPTIVSNFQTTELKPKPFAPKGGNDYATQLFNDNQ